MRTSVSARSRRNLARATGTLAAAAVLVLTMGGNAWASPKADAFNRLLAFNPGLSATELKRSMMEAAAATGLTYDQAVTTALGEAESHLSISSANGVSASSGGSSCTTVNIQPATWKGDIYYSASSTYGISHGHVGIYSEKDYVTEARGSGQNSGEWYYYGRKYCKNIQIMTTPYSTATQTSAADYASAYLVNKPYNSNFAWNKGGNIDTLNCSELVYKAYKRSVNIDLDGDGGLGVYPNDIVNDSETSIYRTISA